MRVAPTRYKFKFLKRYYSDPQGFIFSRFRFAKRRTVASRRITFRSLKHLTSFAFRKVRGAYPQFDSEDSDSDELFDFYSDYRLPNAVQKQRFSRPSYYFELLSVKQQFKKFYAFYNDSQLARFIREASRMNQPVSRPFLSLNLREEPILFSPRIYRIFRALEYRLITLLRRSLFFLSTFEARQQVLHGKVFINGIKAQSPNQVLSEGDIVSFSPEIFDKIRLNLASYFRVASWTFFGGEQFFSFSGEEGEISFLPVDRVEDLEISSFLEYLSESPSGAESFTKMGGQRDKRVSIVAQAKQELLLNRSSSSLRSSIPSHMEVDFSIFTISLVGPFRPSTVLLPTSCAYQFGDLPGWYRA